MKYLGDFLAASTVRFGWSSTGVDGASITRATNGTISVYKDLGTTQSTTGVTDTEDFDAVTGVHVVAIDTSADGTFYSAGSDFLVVLSAATIDGKTVNAVLAEFSIQNRTQIANVTKIAGATVSTSTAQLGVNVVSSGAAAGVTGYKKNTAVTAFAFYMALTAGGAATGKTVTVTISKDGGAFAAPAGSITEISGGFYKINFTNTEFNADEIAFLATATSCNTTALKIRTQV